jgi:hypothetical protein
MYDKYLENNIFLLSLTRSIDWCKKNILTFFDQRGDPYQENWPKFFSFKYGQIMHQSIDLVKLSKKILFWVLRWEKNVNPCETFSGNWPLFAKFCPNWPNFLLQKYDRIAILIANHSMPKFNAKFKSCYRI